MTDYRPPAGTDIKKHLRYLADLGIRVPSVKMIKTAEQIAGCREAGRINSLVLDEVERTVRVGMTTREIEQIVLDKTRSLGGVCATVGYRGFPAAVCVSINDVICHGIPSDKQIIREGDIVNVDCTTLYGGYYGDASRMLTFGASEQALRLVELTRRATLAAIEQIRPYETTLGDIGFLISNMAGESGCSVVREIGGHGVGLEMHEDPYVCHVGRKGQGMLLVPGMIFTVEPMINAGSPGFTVDGKDGWTVRTLDGSLSAQVEHEVLVTDCGYEILSR